MRQGFLSSSCRQLALCDREDSSEIIAKATSNPGRSYSSPYLQFPAHHAVLSRTIGNSAWAVCIKFRPSRRV